MYAEHVCQMFRYAQQVSSTAAYTQNVNDGGQLGFDLRFVASAISHIFIASGEMLQLYKRWQELGGFAHRVTGLDNIQKNHYLFLSI